MPALVAGIRTLENKDVNVRDKDRPSRKRMHDQHYGKPALGDNTPSGLEIVRHLAAVGRKLGDDLLV